MPLGWMGWLDLPAAQAGEELSLSPPAQIGLEFARVQRRTGKSAAELARVHAEVARGRTFTARQVQRMIVRARIEVTREQRTCQGCGKPLAAGYRHGVRSHDPACKQLAYRLRKAESG